MEETFDVFISYRREGGTTIARLLNMCLEQYGFHPFLDIDDLGPGDFDMELMETIENTPAFLLVLSRGSLERCCEEEDWVRGEIRSALANEKYIVAVCADNFDDFPSNLPEDIIGIQKKNVIRLTSKESFDKIIRFLKEGIAKTAEKAEATKQQSAEISQQDKTKGRRTGLPVGTKTVTVTVPAGQTIVGTGIYTGNKEIGTVIVPEGITEIQTGAFANCTGLTAVQLPESLTCIPTGAFAGCRNLKEIRFPNALKEIGAVAFFGCSSLESITLPAAVEKIQDGAFAGCWKLKNAAIPENAVIRRDAFAGTKIKQK